MSQPKKWVFTELVQDSDEPEQLIAYAMYKADKDDLARQCSARLLSDSDIVNKLTSFHENIAYSDRRLQDYRDKAKRAVNQLVDSVSERVGAAYDQKIAAMMDNHQSDLQEKWKKWGEDAALYSILLSQYGISGLEKAFYPGSVAEFLAWLRQRFLHCSLSVLCHFSLLQSGTLPEIH
ncbi:hypothetical protein [Erwinia mallotivora]|uniref:Uncharacterized protein n=1 Tax=Erwinia mallotivora TaxID=69222 RepID=A0A014NKP8_9GAMM|nr:hypothetical protein [Erwinia mallotivora]EXU74355.1 hypothetical protein BG55_17780 [Erwinia mallotivora]